MADNHLPIGFTMSLSRHDDALKYYGTLDKIIQDKITDYIQSSTTGNDAKQRIQTSVNGLLNQNTDFLN